MKSTYLKFFSGLTASETTRASRELGILGSLKHKLRTLDVLEKLEAFIAVMPRRTLATCTGIKTGVTFIDCIYSKERCLRTRREIPFK